VPIERAAQLGLGGQQAKPRVTVLLQDELRERRTQNAFAVENDDRALVGKGRDRRIGSILVGRALHHRIMRAKERPIEVNSTSKRHVEIEA
jgi:hypothetical protein